MTILQSLGLLVAGVTFASLPVVLYLGYSLLCSSVTKNKEQE